MGNAEPPPATGLPELVLIFSAICLIVLSMLFSISESAFLSMNKLRLRVRLKENNKRAVRVNSLLRRKDFLINTLLISNDLVNVMLPSILTVTMINIFGEKGIAIATFAATVLLLIFGEITPKAISTRKADSIAYGLSGFVNVVFVIMRPITAICTAIAHCALSIMGIKKQTQKSSFTEEDIKTFLDVGEESGVIEKDENTFMKRVFKFTDLEAQDIMVPRLKIIGVSEKASLSEILELSKRTKYSRFPVYREDIDDIVGIVYIKDLLFCETKDFSLSKVMRPPLFITGTKNMSSIQQMLRENRQAMAIVVDEYSGTDGLLTTSDIAREIFGPNYYGSADEIPENKDSFSVNGSARLIDIKESLHIPITSEINQTLGGWMTEKLGYIPGLSEFVEFADYKFTVTQMTGNYINRIQVQKLSESQNE